MGNNIVTKERCQTVLSYSSREGIQYSHSSSLQFIEPFPHVGHLPSRLKTWGTTEWGLDNKDCLQDLEVLIGKLEKGTEEGEERDPPVQDNDQWKYYDTVTGDGGTTREQRFPSSPQDR